MFIDIHFKDGALWFDLLERESVEPGDSIQLADGLTVTLQESFLGRGGAEQFPQFAHFVVDQAATIPAGIASGLIGAWLYDKLKGKKARAVVNNRIEVHLDDKGHISKVIEEELHEEC
jgi:hypothetical protein